MSVIGIYYNYFYGAQDPHSPVTSTYLRTTSNKDTWSRVSRKFVAKDGQRVDPSSMRNKRTCAAVTDVIFPPNYIQILGTTAFFPLSNFFAQPEPFASGKARTEVRKGLGSCAGDRATAPADDPSTPGALFKFTQGIIRGISDSVMISARPMVSRSLDVVVDRVQHPIGLEPVAVRRRLARCSWKMTSEVCHCQCDSLQLFELHDE
jgi:hypothetical protein